MLHGFAGGRDGTDDVCACSGLLYRIRRRYGWITITLSGFVCEAFGRVYCPADDPQFTDSANRLHSLKVDMSLLACADNRQDFGASS